jgi:type IV secretion system protein VirB10
MTDPATPSETPPLAQPSIDAGVDEALADAPAKIDPESLVLRGTPARVVRFRRGVIVVIAGAGSTAILGAAWLALRPVHLTLPTPDAGPEPRIALPSDALAGAPLSYGDVPRLGPPLPGDLGRPILEHQRSAGAAPLGADPSNVTDQAAERAAQDAEAERQQLIAEERAARQSGVMLQLAGAGRPNSIPAVASMASVAAPSAEPLGIGSVGAAANVLNDPNGQKEKQEFAARRDDMSDINPHRLSPAPSPYTLSAGTVIAASLLTGLNSDLPGLVTAQVTENVYDSATGQILLLPQGARLIGRYDSVVAFGQSRALVMWQRIIMPDSSSIRIDNIPAADLSGYAGLSDRIDRHSWQLLKGVALSTLLGVGSEYGVSKDEGDLVGAIREAAQQSGARAGDQLVSKNLDVQPTLRVRPGWPLRILVNKDIVLPPKGSPHG